MWRYEVKIGLESKHPGTTGDGRAVVAYARNGERLRWRLAQAAAAAAGVVESGRHDEHDHDGGTLSATV